MLSLCIDEWANLCLPILPLLIFGSLRSQDMPSQLNDSLYKVSFVKLAHACCRPTCLLQSATYA